jgi:hypothetical protein
MAGLVPAIHAVKLIPLLRKSLRTRGFTSSEAAARRRGWPGRARL